MLNSSLLRDYFGIALAMLIISLAISILKPDLSEGP
jgi:hypothetical protein